VVGIYAQSRFPGSASAAIQHTFLNASPYNKLLKGGAVPKQSFERASMVQIIGISNSQLRKNEEDQPKNGQITAIPRFYPAPFRPWNG
jgi:hypothetical protein